ncbi:DUF1983 domain-containing protein [Pseudomonas poae]|uniref:phage tail tip fiber protein n=1 Tax=Pseudomonas poae TaxID=200451 RepID=UPI0030D6013F
MQSQFLISADQFAIYNENTPGKPSTPFAVRGAETFINSAFIQNGTITNAKIGSTIQSDALGVNGKPVWILDKSGLFELNSSGPGGVVKFDQMLIRFMMLKET